MSLLLALLLTAAPAKAKRAAPDPHPVQITADKVAIHGKRNIAVWTGHVKAVRQETHLACDRMIAHYDDAQRVTRLECEGHVAAEDGEKWAKGEKADFDNLSGVLVVTGHPEGGQGRNRMKGTQVTFYAGQDEIDVENATAIVESKQVPGQGPRK